ncbi:hypothetical protein PoB_000683200 [Plakobranchus ocellatus]|uniref:Uncharacterized protein n=1 Tax=Plakobranchus ocellatus TaxID=259542 RepID=A0AAV3YBS2_9GAST|nr:hypothetical protein PoB_000683200 [Plakobranchus ocellatus]
MPRPFIDGHFQFGGPSSQLPVYNGFVIRVKRVPVPVHGRHCRLLDIGYAADLLLVAIPTELKHLLRKRMTNSEGNLSWFQWSSILMPSYTDPIVTTGSCYRNQICQLRRVPDPGHVIPDGQQFPSSDQMAFLLPCIGCSVHYKGSTASKSKNSFCIVFP